MSSDDLLARAGDQLSVRRVFGERIEREGVVVVPVAVAMGGGGGGTSSGEQGGGFGGVVRGIGVYEIRDGGVRFVPAIDTTALAVVALVLTMSLARLARRGRRRS